MPFGDDHSWRVYLDLVLPHISAQDGAIAVRRLPARDSV